MTMQRFDPFREIRHFNRLFDRSIWAAPRGASPVPDQVGPSWIIPMDVLRNDAALTVTASLPGFTADDVEVSVSPDRVLSVKAARQAEVGGDGAEFLMRERRAGAFSRAIRLPADLDLDTASVVLDHGVLTVRLPVVEAAQTRRLEISPGSVADAG